MQTKFKFDLCPNVRRTETSAFVEEEKKKKPFLILEIANGLVRAAARVPDAARGAGLFSDLPCCCESQILGWVDLS